MSGIHATLVLTICCALASAAYFTGEEARRRRAQAKADRQPLEAIMERITEAVRKADPLEDCVELGFWLDYNPLAHMPHEGMEHPDWTALKHYPHWDEALRRELEALGYTVSHIVADRTTTSGSPPCSDDGFCPTIALITRHGPSVKVCW